MDYNSNNNNNEPVLEKNLITNKDFMIHIVIGIAILVVFIGFMSQDLLNVFIIFEKLEVVKKIYVIGIFAYIIIGVFVKSGKELNFAPLKDLIKNGAKLIIWWLLIICALYIVCFYYMFFPSKNLGLKDEIKINDVEIPTLYKYTKNEDILSAIDFRNAPGDESMNFISITYKNPIPTNEITTYGLNLNNMGYKKEVIQGLETFTLKLEDNISYICIIIESQGITYGVVTETEYNMLKSGTLMMDN